MRFWSQMIQRLQGPLSHYTLVGRGGLPKLFQGENYDFDADVIKISAKLVMYACISGWH